MKSNVCKIENKGLGLEAILRESEKVAVYNELSHKQSLQLRLLCEEIGGMLPNIVNNYSGDFWIEFDKGLCKINISIELKELTSTEKEELISIAKNRKNTAAVGVSGKIRSLIEDYMLMSAEVQKYSVGYGSFNISTYGMEAVNYPYLWSLNKYKSDVSKETHTEEWDELEKSVIASVADDVLIGVKGKRADIVVIKEFA